MKIAEVKNLSEAELDSKKREIRQELFNLGLQKQTGQLEKPSRIKELKKTVARIETVLTERRNKSAAAKS